MVFRHLISQTYFDNNVKSRTINLDFINELHHCISKQRKKILQTKKKLNIATFPNKQFYITHDYCSTGSKYNTPEQLNLYNPTAQRSNLSTYTKYYHRMEVIFYQ